MNELKLLGMFLGNRVTRGILNKMTGDCPECGNRLYNYLQKYKGVDVTLCRTCELGYKTFFLGAVRGVNKLYGVTDEQLKEFLSYRFNHRAVCNIANGIVDYGLQEPMMSRAPMMVVWNVTKACNLNCPHCYAKAKEPMPGELTTEEALDFIDQAANFGIAAVSFAGGEPLMRRDLDQLVKRCADHDIFIAIATNGTMLTLERAKQLKEAGADYVEVSIDSPIEEEHDQFRGMRGSYRLAWQAIANAREAGMTAGVAFTVTKKNMHRATEMIEMTRGKANAMMFFNFIPTGRGVDMIELDPTPEEREAFLREAYHKFRDAQSEMVIASTAPQLGRVCMQEEGPGIMHMCSVNENAKQLVRLVGGCGAGRLYCALEPNGYVKPCVFMPIEVDSIRYKPFDEIWRGNFILNELRDKEKLKGSCGACEYKTVCGGCRARALALNNDYLEGDPGCINYNKHLIAEKEKAKLSETAKVRSP